MLIDVRRLVPFIPGSCTVVSIPAFGESCMRTPAMEGELSMDLLPRSKSLPWPPKTEK